MVYKNLTFTIVFLQLLLTATIAVFVFTLFQQQMIFTSINLGILIIIEIYAAIYLQNKTNRDLARFFEALQFNDSTFSLPLPGGKAYRPLHQRLSQILKEFSEIKITAENERFFYLNMLNHIRTGILVIDASGQVIFSNRALQKMIGMNSFNDILQLDRLKPGLANQVRQMAPNNKALFSVVSNSEMIRLSACNSQFIMDNLPYTIISFQDIRYEIEQNETEAWQKLISILTHEIMNSVSPITLTAAGIIQMLKKDDSQTKNNINGESRNRVIEGLQAIRKRSKGLAAFVENYQAVSHLPAPVFSTIRISALFSHVAILMRENLQQNQVKLELNVIPRNLLLYADEKLICQALINLIQNAVYAMGKQPYNKVVLTAFRVEDQVRITISDNGSGIPPELLDSVFVPFFTTREHGSGIGLSLTREIMKLHSGGIRVQSNPGEGTTFTLLF